MYGYDEITKCLESDGFFIGRAQFSKEFTESLELECYQFIRRNYTTDTLKSRLFYQRDENKGRVSNSFTIASANNTLGLPTYYKQDFELLQTLYDFWEGFCFATDSKALTQTPFGRNHRTLVNFQDYLGDSEPVPDHLDGEYFKYTVSENKTFNLKQGIIPKYVMVVVLEDEGNSGAPSTELTPTSWGYDECLGNVGCKLRPGDFVVFDNTLYSHSVPSLTYPRSIIGFRNLDHNSYYFDVDGEFNFSSKACKGNLSKIDPTRANTMMKSFIDLVWIPEFDKNITGDAAF